MKKVFFNVDTQRDFMNKNGALYVPGAESIKRNLKELTQYAVKNKIPIMASMDTHIGTEEFKKAESELKRWGGPFPDHCMINTYGWSHILETMTDGDEGTVLLGKHTYDVFSNPRTKPALRDVDKAVVYGVATDYCIKAAVLGMLKMGIKVTVVEDAIKGVAKDTTEQALKEMKDKGAVFKKTKEVI